MTAILHRRAQSNPNHMYGMTRRDLLTTSALGLLAGTPRPAGAGAPVGKLTWAMQVSVPRTWFDPADTQAIVSPYMILYALHDAMVKPMPGTLQGPSLAESWQTSEDGTIYDFTIRDGAKFHNGAPVTGEDVKFSFERYRGGNHDLLHKKIGAVEIPDARHVRFKLNEPWPDFMTFYSSASSSGWIVPKAYVEKVGDDGFKQSPIGAGPYKFVSYNPGVELVLEAFDGYWRKTPSVKRLVMKVIPDESTRLAALKGGEVDIAYAIRGDLARELQATPGLKLKSVALQATNWVYFPEQFDPKSPWHNLQVRQAVNLALDRNGWNDALFLGGCKINNSIIPDSFDYYWQPPEAVYDPAKARKLLAEAGYPNGFDAGPFWCDASFSNMGEVAVNSLQQVGIRTTLQPIERAGFISADANKKLNKGIFRSASGAFGNTATRLASYVIKDGDFAYGSYPDINDLFSKQAVELDRKKREEILHKIQQLVYEKAIFAPIWQIASLNGIGPRLGESSFGRIAGFPFTAPFEDLTIQKG